MDYLKFLLTTVIAVIVLFVDIHFSGAGIGSFFVLGGILAYLGMYRPICHAIAFATWSGLLVLWHSAVKAAVHLNELADPQKYTADRIDLSIGLGMTIGMILFHPISYGISRLILMLFKKAPKPPKSKINPNSKPINLRKYWMLYFAGTGLIGLLIVKFIEIFFDIPQHPYENYASPIPFAIAIIIATYKVWKKAPRNK